MQGHHGITKTTNAIRAYYYFPGLAKWIHALTQDCIPCIKSKPNRKDLQNPKLMSPIRQVTETLHTIHIDYKGSISPSSKGYNYVLMIIDAYSRYVYPRATRNADAKTTLEVMEIFICIFGIPKVIICDRGTHFINREFMNWAANLGIECRPLSGYNPWSNGIVEVQNKFMGTYLKLFVEENPNNWAELIPKWAYAQNTSFLSVIGMTPHEIMFGIKPHVPLNLKMGIFRDKDNLCVRQKNGTCEGLPNHTHYDPTVFNKFTQKFLTEEISPQLLNKEHKFAHIYKTIYEKSKMEDPNEVHRQRNLTRLAKPLEAGQLVLVENKDIKQGISQKLLPRRKGIYKIIKNISPVTYKLQLTTPPHNEIYRHRALLLPYFPKEEKIPALVNVYQHDESDNDEEDDWYYYDDHAPDALNRGNQNNPQAPPPQPPNQNQPRLNDHHRQNGNNDGIQDADLEDIDFRSPEQVIRQSRRIQNQLMDRMLEGRTQREIERDNRVQFETQVTLPVPIPIPVPVPVTPPLRPNIQRIGTPRPNRTEIPHPQHMLDQQRIPPTPHYENILSPSQLATPPNQQMTPLNQTQITPASQNRTTPTPVRSFAELLSDNRTSARRTSTPYPHERTPYSQDPNRTIRNQHSTPQEQNQSSPRFNTRSTFPTGYSELPSTSNVTNTPETQHRTTNPFTPNQQYDPQPYDDFDMENFFGSPQPNNPSPIHPTTQQQSQRRGTRQRHRPEYYGYDTGNKYK